MNIKRRNFYDPISITIISFLIIIPLAKTHSLFSGVDMGFHLNRAFDLYKVLGHGHIFADLNFFTFNQVGMPTNMVYGFIYLYPLAIWMLLIKNKITAIYLGIATIFTLMGILTYYLAKRYYKGNCNQALAFSVIYVVSVYGFNIFFVAFSLAQASAMVFLPLIAYGSYSVIFNTVHKNKDWLLLALGMIGVIYCHLISTLIFSTLVLILLVIGIIERKFNYINFKYFLKSVVVSCLGSSFFWYNFISLYYHNPDINTPEYKEIFGFTFKAFNNAILNQIIGLVILVCVIISFVNWRKLNRKTKIEGLILLIYTFMCLDISNVLWRFLNKTAIRQIQGVNRFSVMILFLSLLFIISSSPQIYRFHSLFLVVICLLSGVIYFSNCYTFLNLQGRDVNIVSFYNKNNISPFSNYVVLTNTGIDYLVQKSYGGVGCLDYWPKSSLKQKDPIIYKKLLYNQLGNHVREKISYNQLQYSNLKLANNGEIVLPFLYYKGINYKITDGNKIVNIYRKNGLMMIKLKSGRHNIKITEHQNSIQKCLFWLSMVTTIFSVITFGFKRNSMYK